MNGMLVNFLSTIPLSVFFGKQFYVSCRRTTVILQCKILRKQAPPPLFWPQRLVCLYPRLASAPASQLLGLLGPSKLGVQLLLDFDALLAIRMIIVGGSVLLTQPSLQLLYQIMLRMENRDEKEQKHVFLVPKKLLDVDKLRSYSLEGEL